MSSTLVWALLAVTVLGACTQERKGLPRPSPSPMPTLVNGKIAFQSDRDERSGVFGVYVMDGEGGEVTRLVEGQASTPQWSPDGKSIAFLRTTDLKGRPTPSAGLYVARSDGSGEVRVNETVVNNFDFSWSPDGKRIVFTGGSPPGRNSPLPDIYVVNADGSGERRLTTASAEEGSPAWSPDGERISFLRLIPKDDGHSSEAFVINADGTGAVRVAEGSGRLAWSPDGSKLAFVVARRSAQYTGGEIFTVSPDGTGATSVTRGEFVGWSPDGRMIFGRYPGDIYSLDADGKDERKLGWSADVNCPVWSPDGKKIVFCRRLDAPPGRTTADQPDIFVMNADGTRVRNLTKHPAQDTDPSWQALGAEGKASP